MNALHVHASVWYLHVLQCNGFIEILSQFISTSNVSRNCICQNTTVIGLLLLTHTVLLNL